MFRFFILIIPALGGIALPSNLFIFELLSLVYVAIQIVLRRQLSKWTSYCFPFILLTALFQLVSDIYHGVDLVTLLKGVSIYPLIGCTVILYTDLARYFGIRPSCLLVLLFARKFIDLTYSILSTRIFDNLFLIKSSYLFAFPLLTLLAAELLIRLFPRSKSARASFFVNILPLSLISLFGLYGGARLLLFVCLLSALLRLSQYYSASVASGSFFRTLQALILNPITAYIAIISFSVLIGAFASAFASVVQFVYRVLFDSVDPILLSKSLDQSSGILGPIVGARLEIFSIIQAFVDKPLLGHGSWPVDLGLYYHYLKESLSLQFGYSNEFNSRLGFYYDNIAWYIPVHSIFWQPLVWSGLFGFVSFCFFLTRSFRLATHGFNSLSLFSVYIYCFLLWNLFFSPLGYSHRFEFSVMLGYLTVASRASNETLKVQSGRATIPV